MADKSVYICEMKTTVAGPKPGFFNFIRWLFEPFQPPVPPPLPSKEEQESILRFLKEGKLGEIERRRSVPEKYRMSPGAAAELEALNEVLSVAMDELDMGFEAAATWAATRPLATFGGQTAVRLIARGQKATVLYYLRSIKNGFIG